MQQKICKVYQESCQFLQQHREQEEIENPRVIQLRGRLSRQVRRQRQLAEDQREHDEDCNKELSK